MLYHYLATNISVRDVTVLQVYIKISIYKYRKTNAMKIIKK